jgi:hypothetical protein
VHVDVAVKVQIELLQKRDQGFDMIRIPRHEPDGEKILKQWNDLIWLRVDPDQLPAWSLSPAPSQEKKQGDR